MWRRDGLLWLEGLERPGSLTVRGSRARGGRAWFRLIAWLRTHLSRWCTFFSFFKGKKADVRILKKETVNC